MKTHQKTAMKTTWALGYFLCEFFGDFFGGVSTTNRQSFSTQCCPAPDPAQHPFHNPVRVPTPPSQPRKKSGRRPGSGPGPETLLNWVRGGAAESPIKPKQHQSIHESKQRSR